MESYTIKPDYYDSYQCKGQDCLNTCCQKWDIQLDKQEYNRLKRLKLSSELMNKKEQMLHRTRGQHTDLKYANIRFGADGYCPMLSTEGLCALQLEAGAEVLADICIQFPRKKSLIDGNVEHHLSLACEAVVEYFCERESKITFISKADGKPAAGKYNTYIGIEHVKQRPVYQYIFDIRELAIRTLQCRALSIQERILTLGLFLQKIDEMEQQNETEKITQYIDGMLQVLDSPEIEFLWKSVAGDVQAQMESTVVTLFDFFSHSKWAVDREKIFKRLGITAYDNHGQNIECDLNDYVAAKRELEAFFNGREFILEHLILTLFLTTDQPFYSHENSIWENYLGFVFLYQLFIALLCGLLTATSTEEEMVQVVVEFARECVHRDSYIKRQIELAQKRKTTMELLAKVLKEQ